MCFAERDYATARARYGPVDEDQMLLGANVNNTEILDRRTTVAILAGHGLALKNFARICTVPNGTAVPKVFMGAMAGGSATHAVAFYDTGITSPLCLANNDDPFPRLKNLLSGYLVSDFVLVNVSSPKLA